MLIHLPGYRAYDVTQQVSIKHSIVWRERKQTRCASRCATGATKDFSSLLEKLADNSSLESISPPHRAHEFTTLLHLKLQFCIKSFFCAGNTERFSNVPPLFFPEAARAFNLNPWCFQKALKADDEETLAAASVRRQGGERRSFD